MRGSEAFLAINQLQPYFDSLITAIDQQQFDVVQGTLKELVSGYQAAGIVDWVSTR